MKQKTEDRKTNENEKTFVTKGEGKPTKLTEKQKLKTNQKSSNETK